MRIDDGRRHQSSDVVEASRVKTKSGTFKAEDLDQRPSANVLAGQKENMTVLNK